MNKTAGEILTPVSVGEVVDKISILEIKNERIKDAAKLKNISQELALLQKALLASNIQVDKTLFASLKKVNEELWDIEDDIRDKERHKQFDTKFIELARAVYITNDKRADLKKQINLATGSTLVEEKSYSAY